MRLAGIEIHSRIIPILIFFIFSSFDGLSFSETLKIELKNNTKVLNPANRDAMFFTMATGNKEKASDYTLNLTLKYSIGYRFGQSNDYMLEITGQEVNVTGNTNYRGFDLSRYFKPDLLSGYIDFGSSHHNSRRSFITSFSVDKPIGIFRIDPQFIQQQPSMQHVTIELVGYSENALKEFDAQTRQIDKYWATVSLYDSIFRQVQRYGIDESSDVSLLFAYFDLTGKAARLGNEMISELNIIREKNDPGNLLENNDKISRLNIRLETLTRQYTESKTKQPVDAKAFADKYISYLVRFRSLANSVNYRGSEQFYHTGRLSAHASFKRLLTDIDKSFFGGIATQYLYNGLIFKGDSLANEGNLAHALDFLNDAKDLSVSVSTITPDLNLDARISKLKEGLLQSIILIASRSLTAGKTELAQSYIDNAIRFKAEHLNDDELIVIERTIDPFVTALVETSASLIYYKRYNEAIELGNKALNVINSFKAIPHYWPLIRQQLKTAHKGVYMDLLNKAQDYAEKKEFSHAEEYAEYAIRYRFDHIEFLDDQREADQLLVSIRKPQISNLIGNGLNEIAKGNASHALDHFEKADQLSSMAGKGHDVSLDSLKILAVKNMIISSLRSLDLKIWANELDEASLVYQEALSKTADYGIGQDPEIKAAFKRMEEKISDRMCLNDRLEYEELVHQAKRSAKQGKLDMVRKNLDRAGKIISNNPGCLTDTDEWTSLAERFSVSFNFAEKYKQLYNKMYELGFSSVLNEYVVLDSLYSAVATPQDDFRPITLGEFIKAQNNPSLSFMAAKYFAEKGKTMTSLSYLNLLRKQGGFEKQTREIQILLAHQAARLVSLQGIHEFRSKTVDDFVENDPWYKVFRQEFAKMRKLARD